MADPKLLQLTAKDKAHYRELIKKIDINQKGRIVNFLLSKLDSLVEGGDLNKIEIDLIDDVSWLMGTLEFFPDLPERTVQKILFALSYFIDENDEIPDMIPEIGYLDDMKVAKWIVNDIRGQIPKLPDA
ncbi:MAG: DUF1232 domain-containing protein [Candidatus Neomarinimicrobiota bacterium]|nr:DUF1232 domain-containing protein [Candidatus Neomarinimicrobiota bacterium]